MVDARLGLWVVRMTWTGTVPVPSASSAPSQQVRDAGLELRVKVGFRFLNQQERGDLALSEKQQFRRHA